MIPALRNLVKNLEWLYWLAGVIVISSLGLAAVHLPLILSVALLAIIGIIGWVFISPWSFLVLLFLVRSSADITQSIFVLFPSSWYSFNAAGVLNILAVGSGLLVILNRLRKMQIPIPSLPLGLFTSFLLVAAIGIPGSIDIGASIKEWSRLGGTLGIALLVIESVKNEKAIKSLLRVITIAAIPPLVLGYYQAATGSGYYFEGAEGTLFAFRPQGTFGHPAILATFLIFIICLSLASIIFGYRLWPRLILFSLAGASMGLLLLTYARTEWLGALAAFCVIGLLRYRRILLIGLVTILILVLVVPSIQERISGEKSSESVDWRFEVWGASLNILREPTLIGSGLDTSPILINKQLPLVFSPPHNDYLKVAIETGLIGLLILILLDISLVVCGWKAYRLEGSTVRQVLGLTLLSTTFAGIVISFSDNYLSYVSYQWYYWAIVALLSINIKLGGNIITVDYGMEADHE
jgi:O-antigen ligase